MKEVKWTYFPNLRFLGPCVTPYPIWLHDPILATRDILPKILQEAEGSATCINLHRGRGRHISSVAYETRQMTYLRVFVKSEGMVMTMA